MVRRPPDHPGGVDRREGEDPRAHGPRAGQAQQHEREREDPDEVVVPRDRRGHQHARCGQAGAELDLAGPPPQRPDDHHRQRQRAGDREPDQGARLLAEQPGHRTEHRLVTGVGDAAHPVGIPQDLGPVLAGRARPRHEADGHRGDERPDRDGGGPGPTDQEQEEHEAQRRQLHAGSHPDPEAGEASLGSEQVVEDAEHQEHVDLGEAEVAAHGLQREGRDREPGDHQLPPLLAQACQARPDHQVRDGPEAVDRQRSPQAGNDERRRQGQWSHQQCGERRVGERQAVAWRVEVAAVEDELSAVPVDVQVGERGVPGRVPARDHSGHQRDDQQRPIDLHPSPLPAEGPARQSRDARPSVPETDCPLLAGNHRFGPRGASGPGPASGDVPRSPPRASFRNRPTSSDSNKCRPHDQPSRVCFGAFFA